MEVKKMIEHLYDILCSSIFLIFMEIIFKSANLYLTRYEEALIILKTSHNSYKTSFKDEQCYFISRKVYIFTFNKGFDIINMLNVGFE